MKRHLLSAALLAGLSLAAATNAPKLSLEQQAVRADVIVRATVEASSSVQESGQTWTVYPLTILETVAGDAQSLPQYQNKPSLWVLSGVQDAPVLPSGDSMLLLYKERYDSPLVGFNQGKYTLQSTGGAAAKVVTGLPDGTPGVVSSIPAVGANPLSTPPAVTTAPPSAAPNTNPPAPVAASAAPAVVDPAAPTGAALTVAPAAPTPPALASAVPPASAQGDSLQASASASPPAPVPSASAPASDPAPSGAAAAPPIVPTVSESSATASAGSATASASSTAPAGQALASPAAPSAAATSSAPTPPPAAEAKTTDSTPVPVSNNPIPNNPVPNNTALTLSTAAPAVPNVAAPLQPGQMTLEAFRKLVLEARAKVGK